MFPASFTIRSSRSALPSTEKVQFAGNIHPFLQLTSPVEAVLTRIGGSVLATADRIGLSATGRSSGEALDALGRALAERYMASDEALRALVKERELALLRKPVLGS